MYTPNYLQYSSRYTVKKKKMWQMQKIHQKSYLCLFSCHLFLYICSVYTLTQQCFMYSLIGFDDNFFWSFTQFKAYQLVIY